MKECVELHTRQSRVGPASALIRTSLSAWMQAVTQLSFECEFSAGLNIWTTARIHGEQ